MGMHSTPSGMGETAMMKVIKEGNVPEIFEQEVTCEKYFNDSYDLDGCGAVLRIQEADLVLRYFFGTHFRHYYPAVKCPRCGKFTSVKVPSPVFERINTEESYQKATFDGFDDR